MNTRNETEEICRSRLATITGAVETDDAETARVNFLVSEDVQGDGRHELVRLWAHCGPGDESQPVITVMVDGEENASELRSRTAQRSITSDLNLPTTTKAIGTL